MINARKLLVSVTLYVTVCAAPAADERFDESVRSAVARFDRLISANGLQTSVQEILQQAADEGNYFVLLERDAWWGFSVSGDSPRVIRYFSSRLSHPVRCEIAAEDAYGGIGLWTVTEDTQISTSHQEVIVSERVAGTYQTAVYAMSGEMVELMINRTRLNLLMTMVESCIVTDQRVAALEVGISNH